MFRNLRSRACASAAIAVFAAGVIQSPPVDAGLVKNFDARKSINWTFKTAPAAAAKGKFNCRVYAYANDEHLPIAPNPKIPGDTGYPVSGSATCDEERKANPAFGTWTLSEGATGEGLSVRAGKIPHPDAQSEANFFTDDLKEDNGLKSFTGWIDIEGQAAIPDKNQLKNHKGSKADAQAFGQMVVQGGIGLGSTIRQGQKVDTSKSKYIGKSSLRGGVGRVRDPISIVLEDVLSGESVTEQLYSLDIDFGGVSELSWTETGIRLQADPDGSSAVSISGGFDSDWIVGGPWLFSASLGSGVFETTGAFDSLPWALTMSDSSVVSAYLAPEHIPLLEAEYSIPSSAFFADDRFYQQTLLPAVDGAVGLGAPGLSTMLLLTGGLGTFAVAGCRRGRTRKPRVG